MDANEETAVDVDVLVYKSARDLIPEIQNSLQCLLWKDSAGSRVRKWTVDPKKVCISLERFLELPQLLDPYLSAWVSSLSNAFVCYLRSYVDEYVAEPPRQQIPLPRAVSRVLYHLCNVRGAKVVLRLFPNEPKYLDLVLKSFAQWNSAASLTWEERYIMLFWLSHLLYTPFDLSTVSSISVAKDPELGLPLPPDLPVTATALCHYSFESLLSPRKEQDAASAILIRLSMRPDLKKYKLFESIFSTMCANVRAGDPDEVELIHQRIGGLTAIAGLLKAAPEKDVWALIQPTFDLLAWIHEEFLTSRERTSDARMRILFVKVVRIGLIRSLASTEDDFCEEILPSVTDFAINALMNSLEDRDTRVRLASSKALSLATRKFQGLEGGNDESIIDMILSGIEPEVELVDLTSGAKIQASQFSQRHAFDLSNVHRNFELSQPLKWHGYMLCLAQLILHRSVPPEMLSRVVRSLFCGLDFHQDSVSGRSMSVQVRDAACFGFWALARKYTTEELQGLVRWSVEPSKKEQLSQFDFIQLMARSLVIAACVDPHGNVRRGTSAALQELIGRHPDVVVSGLDLVHLVDYTTVSNRRLAMITLSKDVSPLNRDYCAIAASALLGWRGVTAPDAASRRKAAEALPYLRSGTALVDLPDIFTSTIESLSHLPMKASYDKRHGLLLGLSALINLFVSLTAPDNDPVGRHSTKRRNKDELHAIALIHSKLSLLFEKVRFGSVYTGDRPHGGLAQTLLFEGVCALIASICGASHANCISADKHSSYPSSLVDCLRECLRSRDSTVAVAASKASSELFLTLTESDKRLALESIQSSFKTSLKTEVYLAALAGVYRSSETNFTIELTPPKRFHDLLTGDLIAATSANYAIEIRCAALEALADVIRVEAARLTGRSQAVNESFKDIWSDNGLLSVALTDYTTDHRGDIGSKARISGLRVLRTILQSKSTFFPNTPDSPFPKELISAITILLKLAAERLDRVRLEAWSVLRVSGLLDPSTLLDYDSFADERSVTSIEYFTRIFALLDEYPILQYSFLEGFVTAAHGGTQSLIRNSRHAIIQFLSSSSPSACNGVFFTLNTVLTKNGGLSPNDRYLIPTLHLLAFILDQGFFPLFASSPTNGATGHCDLQALFRSFKQSLSMKGRTIARLEAAVYCYEALMLHQETRSQAKGELERLSRLKQTTVRKLAEDALFLRGDQQERKKLLESV